MRIGKNKSKSFSPINVQKINRNTKAEGGSSAMLLLLLFRENQS